MEQKKRGGSEGVRLQRASAQVHRYYSEYRKENRPRPTDLAIAKGSVFLQAIVSKGWGVYMSERKRNIEARLLQEILNACYGNVSQAARLMHLDRNNLYRLMKRLGVS